MKQQLTGRITSNAKVNSISGNREVVNFTVVVNDTYKTKSGEREQLSTFIECAYWRNSTVAKYLTKGQLVTVAGFIRPGAYLNKKGEPVGTIKCTVSEIDFLSKSDKTAKSGSRKQTADAAETTDDLPF